MTEAKQRGWDGAAASVLARSVDAYRAGDRGAAIALARQAAESGGTADAARLLALFLAEAGQLSEALEWSGRALALDPASASHAAFGRISAQAGRLDAAETAFRTALSLDPASKPARDGLAALVLQYRRSGLQLFQEKSFDAAAHALDAAVRLSQPDPALWHDLGTARLEAGDLAGARPCFLEALALDPARVETWHNLGSLHQTCRELDAALRAFARAWRLQPDSLPRIAQELASGPAGQVWLSADGLARDLARHAPAA